MGKKGVGTTIGSIIIILVLFFFLYMFVAMSTSHSQKKLELNLNEAELLRLKNTFSLLEKSLKTTWYVSSVQAIFNTGKESIGCGLDDYIGDNNEEDKMKGNFLDFGYWYQYSDPKQAKGTTISGGDDIPWISPNGKKYNRNQMLWPHICYPLDQHILDYLNKKLEPYKAIEKVTTGNGINFNIDNINGAITKNADGFSSTFTQTIKAVPETSENPKTIKTVEIKNDFKTSFLDMAQTGRSIVDASIDISKKLDSKDNRGTSQMRYMMSDSKDFYLSRIEGYLSSVFRDKVTNNQIGISTTIPTKTLRVGGEKEGYDPSLDKWGLLLHYKSNILMGEVGDGMNPLESCAVKRYSNEVEKATESWTFKDQGSGTRWDEFLIYSRNNIKTLVYAMIHTESSCIVSPPERQISPCGAVGLMQLMPGTANKDLGLKVYNNEVFTSCHDGNGNVLPDVADYVNRLKNWVTGKTYSEIIAEDERFDPEKNVKGGTKYLQKLFSDLNIYTSDPQELMKLVIAAYNTGTGSVASGRGVIGAIDKAVTKDKIDGKNVKYCDIDKYLLEDARKYVRKVASYYSGSGSDILSIECSPSYYYHDEESNIFVPGTFSLSMKTEDYLRVLDCVKDVPSDLPKEQIYWFYSWNSGRDLACCGGKVWICGLEQDDFNFGSQNIAEGEFVPAPCEWSSFDSDNKEHKYGLKCIGGSFAMGEKLTVMRQRILSH